MGVGFIGVAGLFLLNQLVSTVQTSTVTLGQDVRTVELTLETGNVGVNVITGKGTRPTLERSFTSSLRSPGETLEQDRDTLRVRANCGRFTGDCSTDYQLTVPAQTQVTVRTGRGHVSVKGLRASLAAQVDVGDVRLADVRGRRITAHSQTGNVTLSEVRFRTADARTDRGQVRVDSTSGFSRLRAISRTGDVVVTLPHRAGPYSVDASSREGSRTVGVPNVRHSQQAASASVEARTVRGDVTISGD